MLKRRWILLLSALAVLCLLLAACGGKPFAITLTNNIGFSLSNVSIANTDGEGNSVEVDWTEDALPNGESRTVSLKELSSEGSGIVTIRLVDTDGDAYEFTDIPLTDGDAPLFDWTGIDPKVTIGEEVYTGAYVPTFN